MWFLLTVRVGRGHCESALRSRHHFSDLYVDYHLFHTSVRVWRKLADRVRCSDLIAFSGRVWYKIFCLHCLCGAVLCGEEASGAL